MAKRRRRKSRSGHRLSVTSAVTLVVGVLLYYVAGRVTAGPKTPHVEMVVESGMLDRVVTNPSLPERIINYDGMTVSFNPEAHIPNWVAWELTKAEIDNPVASRKSASFAVDPAVDGCALMTDYRGSGYDRGHMAPAADMKWSEKALAESFYLTNMCPQVHALNGGSWNKLEERCRLWAQIDSALIIVCGPVLSDGVDTYIGETQVAVPKRFFKVVLSPWANPPGGIGFIMPNSTVKGGLQACAVSIDSVEAVTGHDFFTALPDSLEREIESQCRINYWLTRR